jgi:hypothetical protein
MILSDRVSGNVPAWGFAVAAVLALVSLPGWSLAQNPAETTAASSHETATPHEQTDGSTSARLDQIESELKRLSRMLEEAKQAEANLARATRARSPNDTKSAWRRLKVIDKNPSGISFEGVKRNYFVSFKEDMAHLMARSKEGKLMWHTRLIDSVPVVSGADWAIKEYDDPKQVVVTCTVNDTQIVFCLDMNTGKMLEQNRRGLDDRRIETREEHRLPEAATVKRAHPVLALARGQDRIYILGGAKHCFLSAQTGEARQVWRSEFDNPLLNEQFARAWHEFSNGPFPKSGLVGNWTVEESGDQRIVVVSWTGMGMMVTLRFDAASGKFISDSIQKVEQPNPAMR